MTLHEPVYGQAYVDNLQLRIKRLETALYFARAAIGHVPLPELTRETLKRRAENAQAILHEAVDR